MGQQAKRASKDAPKDLIETLVKENALASVEAMKNMTTDQDSNTEEVKSQDMVVGSQTLDENSHTIPICDIKFISLDWSIFCQSCYSYF